ncbi:MAG: hypothetical protein QM636_09285 [Rhizobium sp.]
MDDGIGHNTVLTILAEVPDARACLDAALVASDALLDAEIVALHVRVDPFDDIMPTEEVLTSEQIVEMRLETSREGKRQNRIVDFAFVDLHPDSLSRTSFPVLRLSSDAYHNSSLMTSLMTELVT